MRTPAKRTIIPLAGAALLLAVLFAVSRSTRPPPLPSDAEHGHLDTNASCGPCHGQGARWSLAAGHPPKDDCLYCHRPGRRP